MCRAVWYNWVMAKVRAYAKINLSLDITGASGVYHMIDSIVCSVNIFDEVTVQLRPDGKINIEMHGMGSEQIPPENNNAFKAASAFAAAYGGGYDIFISKNIPMGAGLGGSSADVAGVLNALSVECGITDYEGVKRIADSVGSDCGYMLRGGCARITGRGERVCALPEPPALYLIIAFPEEGVPTGKCYSLADVYPAEKKTSVTLKRAICAGQFEKIAGSLSNGLYPAACILNGEVREAFSSLSALTPAVNMTGSGSAVYALFPDKISRDEALLKYNGKHRVVAAQTIIPERYI